MRFNKILFFILFIVIIPLCSCNNSPDNIHSNDQSDDKKYSVTVNDILFEFNSCTKYESNIYEYNYYVLDVAIKNNQGNKISVNSNIFNFTNGVKLIDDIVVFFTKIDDLVQVDTQILLQADKNLDIKKVNVEIDFSITSIGKKFNLGHIVQKNSNEKFEKMLLDKFGSIKKEHYDIILEIFLKESLGLVYDYSYTFIEELNEDTYLFFTSKGKFSFSFDENMIVNVMHFYQSTIYDIYIDGERNPLYLSDDRIQLEFNKNTWQIFVDAFIKRNYIDAISSNFQYGRVDNSENSMAISFDVSGKNVFGMPLNKCGILYLIYNNDEKEFEISYFKIGDEILVDNRITISYITNCSQTISSQKINKYSTIKTPNINLSKEGYTFIGWAEKGQSQLFNFDTIVNKNTTLEAKWEANDSYECNLIIDDLTIGIDNNKINITYLSHFSLPIPEKNKYEFEYWYCINEDKEVILTDSKGKSIIKFPFESGINIYPKFKYSPKNGVIDVEYLFDEEKEGYYISSFKGSGDIIFDPYYNEYPVIGIKRNSYGGYLPDAKNITSITFPDTFRYIEDDFIHYSNHVENSLYIYFENPDSIIELGYSQQITALNKIFIGKNCEVIDRLFVKNANITISEENKYFIIDDSCLYSRDYSILYYVFSYDSEIYINHLVEDIKDYAVSNCTNLKKIHLSENLKRVGSYSLYINGGAITEYYFYGVNDIEVYGAVDYIVTSFYKTIIHVKEEGYNPFNFEKVTILVDIK